MELAVGTAQMSDKWAEHKKSYTVDTERKETISIEVGIATIMENVNID